MTCHEAEPLLNAYLDGELDLTHCLNVEQHLTGCSTCQSHYASLEKLHADIVGADLRYEPNDSLQRKIRSSYRRPTSWRVPTLLAAAAALLLTVVWPYAGSAPSPDDRELVDSHLHSLTLNHLVDVPSSDQHTVKPWFEGKTSFSPPVLDLTSQGFPLIGGRLEVLHQQPIAALVYKRRQHVISVYISPASVSQSKNEESEISGYHLVRWSSSGFRYSAVSDLNVAELRTFADLFKGR